MKSWLLIAFLFLAGCSSKSPGPAASPDLAEANASSPGQTVELEKVLVKGKSTVIEFYSDNCPPCLQMAPVVESIARAHPDTAFRKLNVDRQGMREIDFQSPLATQWKIDRVPYFQIYDDKGSLISSGDQAKDQMRTWYSAIQSVDHNAEVEGH